MSAACRYVHTYYLSILPKNLAGANFCIKFRGVESRLASPQPQYALASQIWVRRAGWLGGTNFDHQNVTAPSVA
jgi:hypothetical protein